MKLIFVRYDCVQLSVEHLDNCRENLVAAESNPIRFLFAANAAHLALVSSLTEVLTQYDRFGAFNPKAAERYSKNTRELPKDGVQAFRMRTRPNEQKFLDEEERKLPPLDLKVESLAKLIEKANEVFDDGSCRGFPLKLTYEEEDMIYQLIYIRDQIEHPKPNKYSSFDSGYFMKPILVAVKVAAKLIDEIDNLEDYRRKQAAEVAREIEQTCIRLMSGKA
jgi:hypothetical protein